MAFFAAAVGFLARRRPEVHAPGPLLEWALFLEFNFN